tara:strand:- start:177813 stop:178043 length:231 start_codon:yes stop_codon:yes gene_type:complete
MADTNAKLKKLREMMVLEHTAYPAPTAGSVADIWYTYFIKKIDEAIADDWSDMIKAAEATSFKFLADEPDIYENES